MARRIKGHEVIGAAPMPTAREKPSKRSPRAASSGMSSGGAWVPACMDPPTFVRSRSRFSRNTCAPVGRFSWIQPSMNATLARDTNGNPRLGKSRTRGRIDALQAAVLAVGLGRRWRLRSPDRTIVRSPHDYVLTELYT